MPPGGGGGEGEHGRTVQDHPPAPVCRDEVDAPPHFTPPLPASTPVASQEKRQRHEDEQQQAASLPEGPLVEILARVPYRSFCRFKCVSKPWLALCSSRDIIRRSPQTLSGFFYYAMDTLNFRNLPDRGPPLVDPSLAFLRDIYAHISVDQVCGGLLLCSCRKLGNTEDKSNYVVCNPATEEWTVLPPRVYPGQEFDHLLDGYIGFDAGVPSRFVVFAPLTIHGDDSGIMAIYSSETGQWSYVQSKWASGVDSEGKVWREIKMPDGLPESFDNLSIGKSQGRLYAWMRDDLVDTQLYIWVLEDYGAGKWTLKHTVKILELFGRHCHEVVNYYAYPMFALHPDCNVIFLTDGEKTTVSYDLESHKVDVICTESTYGLPYIPCFAELPSAGH
ncbi:hypothetical protein ACQ4PT_045745 [Festuca glaucescens]